VEKQFIATSPACRFFRQCTQIHFSKSEPRRLSYLARPVHDPIGLTSGHRHL